MKAKQLLITAVLLILTITLNAQNQNTQLIDAAKQGDYDKVKQLIEQGADVNTTDENGATVLMWAVYSGNLDLVKFLVNNNADYSAHKSIIYTDKKHTGYYGNLLGIAADKNKTKILKYLLDSCNINANDKEYNTKTKQFDGWQAIHWAANKGNDEIIKILLNKNANINAIYKGDGNTPLTYAAQNNNYKTVKLLLEHGADPTIANNNKWAIAHYLARDDKEYLLKQIINIIDINRQTTDGYTPLWLAVYNNNIEIAFLLVKNKADVNLKDNNGYNALDYAAYAENTKIKMLLENPKKYKKLDDLLSIKTWEDINHEFLKYYNDGNYTKALETAEKAKQQAEKEFDTENSKNYAGSCNNLAALYKAMGNYQKAEPLYSEAKNIYEKVLGKEHPSYATDCNNLALLYKAMGNYQKAEPLYLEAKNIDEKVLGKEHPSYATACNNLALLYDAMGNYKKAEPLYLEAKNIREKVLGKEHPDYAGSCNNLANLYWAMGNYQKAEPLYLEANTIINKLANQSANYMSEKEREKYLKKNINYYYDIYYSFYLSRKKNQGKVFETAYNNALQTKSRLLRSIIAQRRAILESGDQELIKLFDKYLATGKIIAAEYAKAVNKRRKNLKTLELQLNSLEKQLNRKVADIPAFSKLTRNEINWKKIQNKLKKDETAVEFINFNYHNGKKWTDSILYYALILQKDYIAPKAVFLFEEKQLDSLLQTAYKKNQNKENDYNSVKYLYGKSSGTSHNLYKLVWQPIEKYLKKDKSVYLSPSGLLNKISFYAVPSSSGDLLSEKYKLNYRSVTSEISSGNAFSLDALKEAHLFGGLQYNIPLDELQNFRAKEKDLLVSFNTDQETRSVIWKTLPGSKKEVEQIRDVLSGKLQVSTYLDKEGNEATFKNLENHKPNLIHLATHGFYFPVPEQNHPKKITVN